MIAESYSPCHGANGTTDLTISPSGISTVVAFFHCCPEGRRRSTLRNADFFSQDHRRNHEPRFRIRTVDRTDVLMNVHAFAAAREQTATEYNDKDKQKLAQIAQRPE